MNLLRCVHQCVPACYHVHLMLQIERTPVCASACHILNVSRVNIFVFILMSDNANLCFGACVSVLLFGPVTHLCVEFFCLIFKQTIEYS